MTIAAIRTERLDLPIFDLELITALLDDPSRVDRFAVPDGWPDDDDLEHLLRWRSLAEADGGASAWRARALVLGGTLVGHAGFHGPPGPIDEALDDPTFEGRIDPCGGGVVEIGYTVLSPFRGSGLAVEATRALLDWARSTGEVGAVIACVRPANAPSLVVLERIGGFERIGSCRDGEADELVFRHDLG